MILSLHHVQVTIPVGAEPEARWFYCDLLGLSEIDKPPSLRGRGGLWLQVGDRQLHVGTEDGVDRHRTKAHVAYEVDDVEPWRNQLAQHGIKLLDSVPIEGFARFEARDPFGNRIEFIQTLVTKKEPD
jgi:catechol 2,3-dioxygenase-like lactoylglutathione lyase family enzyme